MPLDFGATHLSIMPGRETGGVSFTVLPVSGEVQTENEARVQVGLEFSRNISLILDLVFGASVFSI